MRPYFFARRWKNGNSYRHGPHHDAHWFTTIGCPRSWASRRSKADGPPSRIWFAWAFRSWSAVRDGLTEPAGIELELAPQPARAEARRRRVATRRIIGDQTYYR